MDKVQIGEVIRSLRKSKNITQEQLANFIGVSTPAVSKWESGISYPDISVLPILANYFEVTIDELLNYKSELSEEQIVELIGKCESLLSRGQIKEVMNLCDNYIKKYSSNYNLKLRLNSVYTLLYIRSTDENEKELITKKAIEILEDVVNNSKDIELKEGALAHLSSKYLISDELDKAEETIKKVYKPSINPDVMLPSIYMQQGRIEEAKKIMQENLNNALGEIMTSCMGLAIAHYNYKEDMDEEEIDYDKAINYYNLAIDVIHKYYGGSIEYSLYINLAHIYMKQNNEEECLRTLRKVIECISSRNINIPIDLNQIWCFDKLDSSKVDLKIDAYQNIVQVLKDGFKNLDGNSEFESIIKEVSRLKEKYKF